MSLVLHYNVNKDNCPKKYLLSSILNCNFRPALDQKVTISNLSDVASLKKTNKQTDIQCLKADRAFFNVILSTVVLSVTLFICLSLLSLDILFVFGFFSVQNLHKHCCLDAINNPAWLICKKDELETQITIIFNIMQLQSTDFLIFL